MDNANVEKISEFSNVEKRSGLINQSEVDIKISKNSEEVAKDGDKNTNTTENVCQKLEDITTTMKNKTTIEKETIEILKVELVLPRTEPHNTDYSTKDDSTNIKNVISSETNSVNEKEKHSLLDSGSVTTENEAQKQLDKCAYLESEKIEKINTNVQSAYVEEKTILSKDQEELITCNSMHPSATVPSGLSLLAQYQSDDDTESVIEVPIISNQDYRNHVVEIDSDSESDDSSNSSDVEYLKELRKTIEKRVEIADDDEDDGDNEDNSGKKRHQQKLRVKGEMLLEDLPPIQDLQITVEEDECIEFGRIHSIVDQLVLVSALPNSVILDLETVMFLEKGKKVLGEVFDVLGQVADPLYCVRFNSNNQIKEKQIKIGDVVYLAPKTQYTQYLILSNLMNVRGSDASWENDIEPPPRFLDYSDDEQEQLARRQLRNKNRSNDNEDLTKKRRTIEAENESTSNRFHNSSTNYRNRSLDQRTNRSVSVNYSNINTGLCYGGPQQYHQRTSNHHRNSWHSTFNRQSSSHLRGNYGLHSEHNRSQSSQAYSPHLPVNAMPPMPNIPYPPIRPTQYGPPPMFHQYGNQIMPNGFIIRPSIFQSDPSASNQHSYTSSTTPPPPGSQ